MMKKNMVVRFNEKHTKEEDNGQNEEDINEE